MTTVWFGTTIQYMGTQALTATAPLQNVHMEVAIRVERLALTTMETQGAVLEKMLDSAQRIAEMSSGSGVDILV